jgi:putative Mg2+ transporter-C (MgtC) family protein
MEGHWVFCLQLLEASVLGGLIGCERELAGKQAGMRTNILICFGAALVTHVSVAMAASSPGGDPSRIAAQVITGIGFLGAGTIIRSGHVIHGLTSAATIWVVAGVGMAVGAGLHHHAVLGTLLILVTLIALGRVERRTLGQKFITLALAFRDSAPEPESLLAGSIGRRRMLSMERGRTGEGPGRLVFSWKGAPSDAEVVVAAAARLPGVSIESWRVEE